MTIKNKAERFDLVWVLIATICSSILAFHVYKMKEVWPGLPPTPSQSAALFYGFGDTELSYRNMGLMLQNAGDTGGRTTNLQDYDYAVIENWLWLTNKFNNRSGYVPTLAAYYFGAAKDPKQLAHLIDYLAHVGMDNKNERWRWLAHAVFLARFKLEDQPRALELAKKLASISDENMPGWTKVMPAYVMNTMGEKREARDLLLLIMADPNSFSDRADVNQSCWYINEHLREPNDNLENNEIFKVFCLDYLASEKKAEEARKAQQAEASPAPSEEAKEPATDPVE